MSHQSSRKLKKLVWCEFKSVGSYVISNNERVLLFFSNYERVLLSHGLAQIHSLHMKDGVICRHSAFLIPSVNALGNHHRAKQIIVVTEDHASPRYLASFDHLRTFHPIVISFLQMSRILNDTCHMLLSRLSWPDFELWSKP